jgi:hypothetical protein
MRHWFPALGFAILLTACATTHPPVPNPDPSTDPTIAGAVEGAVVEGSMGAAAGAEVGLRIGRVAGVLAAVFGGPQRESVDDMIDRYRMTRDAAVITGAVIGAAKGGVEGAKQGYDFDLQFAELHKIEGLEVIRYSADEFEGRFANAPAPAALDRIAAIFTGRQGWLIDVEGADGTAFDIRDSLIDRGLTHNAIDAHRNANVRGVVLHIRAAIKP